MNWLTAGRPAGGLSYLGCVLQEVGYRVAKGDPAGPRTTALLGAILASAAMLGWLRARGVDAWVALACSLIFLLDPVFVQGYRGARVDAWTMGFMMLALWAIRALLVNKQRHEAPTWKPRDGHLLAAACVAISGLFWVSAILLVPLLIHELLCDRSCEGKPHLAGNRLLGVKDLIWVGVFSVGFFALLLFPICQDIYQGVANLATGTSGVVGAHRTFTDFKAVFIETFKYNPWALVGGCASLLVLRRWPLGFAFLLAMVGVLATSFYIHRAVYLLPYLYLAIALVANRFLQPNQNRVNRRFVGLALLFMLVWCCGVTLGARTLKALQQRQTRDPQQILDLATRAIGPGSHCVYLDNCDGYYAGRKLGWKLFHFYDDAPPGSTGWNDLLATMDFALFSVGDVSDQEDEGLRTLGFSRERFECDASLSVPLPGIAKSKSGYGPFWVYRRQ
ncbi:MAG: hypothetical protein WCS31_04705 [Verrucomicrobiae bacterium]